MGKISKKTCKKLIFLFLFIVLITLVGIFFYKYREGLDTNRVGTAKGGWGGSCTCPDGKVYQVSDNNSNGKELACYGGVSGKINRFSGPWSGKSVTCAPKVKASEPKSSEPKSSEPKSSEPKSSGLKDYVYNSVNQKLDDLKKLYKCQVGMGKAASSYHYTTSNSYESCAKDCDQNKECKAFDYTINSSSKAACRLYNNTDSPRLGIGGSDNRQYCSQIKQN